MKQEYLFKGNEHRKEMEDYVPGEGITCEIEDLEDTDCWIVRFRTEGNDEQDAKKLSKLHRDICWQYMPSYLEKEMSGLRKKRYVRKKQEEQEKLSEKEYPVVLKNGSSAYFTENLYPYFNRFERKLRKLLYTKSALAEATGEKNTLRRLEERTIGEIFDMLFIGKDFVTEVRMLVNENGRVFSKEEILKEIQGLEENKMWDKLIGRNAVPALRHNFVAIQKFRNDVMHAHHMDARAFDDAKSLIRTVNRQIDEEIGKILRNQSVGEDDGWSSNFNQTLNEAMRDQERLTKSRNAGLSASFFLDGQKDFLSCVSESEREDPKSVVSDADWDMLTRIFRSNLGRIEKKTKEKKWRRT